MNIEWRTFLLAAGGIADDAGITHFGDPAAELAAAEKNNVRVDLSHLTLLRARGADAETFLQGQLSNDVRQLTAEHGQLSSYCTPKGRMLAVLHLMRDGDDILIQLPASLAVTVLPRLKMFILRSKVTLEEVGDKVAIGLSGPLATELVSTHFGASPSAAHDCIQRDGMLAMALPGIHPRYQIVATPSMLRGLWQKLEPDTRAGGYPVWRWLDIEAGVPSVWPPSSEAFVPQTTNLELLGGVNFKKGCYPGQEIVARMQYLGKLKQRMVHGHVDGDRAPQAGDPVYTPAYGDQPAGAVVDASPSPRGGFDLLVVAPIDSATNNDARLHAPSGTPLKLAPPPYPLVAGSSSSR